MKKKFQKIFIPLCLLSSALALGLFFGLSSWDKNLYVKWSRTPSRGIAGEDSPIEILSLSYDQLSQKASSVLFSRNQVLEKENLVAFYLGNFLAQVPHLKKHHFICQIFSLVEFSFSAIGINLSGEEGLMIIQSPCNMKDKNFIGPFWLPKQDILASSSKSSFELPEYDTFIRFYNASIALTPSWLLTNVRFFNKGQDNEFLIRFVPGKGNPYFELNLKNTASIPDQNP